MGIGEDSASRSWRRWLSKARAGALVLVAVLSRGLAATGAASVAGSPDLDITCTNYREPTVPWSIQVVRVPRRQAKFEVHSLHAQGKALGLGTITDQTAQMDVGLGIPVAAINGDFYTRAGVYAGDPRGLQIVEGEMIRAPTGSPSFWIDAAGEPHITNTVSALQVSWPDGTSAPIELNGIRLPGRIMLYTPALGPFTHTVGGPELVLEPPDGIAWLALRPNRFYPARVREVREGGNSSIEPGTLVLSIGPLAARRYPRVRAGTELTISTATVPVLSGVTTALSGGPMLVREGRQQPLDAPLSMAYEFVSMRQRHPRAAVGWNQDYVFFVVVDGRQRNHSVGMTLAELGAFLVQLGCREALNLDGGGSATVWFNGQVQNRPCDGFERRIANSLVVTKRDSSPARPPLNLLYGPSPTSRR